MRFAAILVVLLTASLRAAEPVDVVDVDIDANGRGVTLVDWPREQRVEFDVWAVRDAWRTIAQQWQLTDRHWSDAGQPRSFDGRFDLGGKSIRLTQRIEPSLVHYDAQANDAIDLVGLFWFFGVPSDAFAGGSAQVGATTIALPVDQPADAFLGEGTTDRVTLVSADRTRRIEVRFPMPRVVRVQDARVFGSPLVQLYTPLKTGGLAAGEHASLDVSLKTTIQSAVRDATVAIHADRRLNRFDGFGGNFVYALDDPATDFVLRELKPTWARIGLDAHELEPAAGDAAATLAARDVAGSPLRRRFELDRRVATLAGGRVVMSLWYPPERLFADHPTAGWRDQPGTIPRDRWPELIDCIVAYLAHLKTHYGVEPKYFGFNESDVGVYVHLGPEETRDMTKQLGASMRDAGLATKILLGDSADLALGLKQIQPTLDDREACAFVGALAYHPWSGQNEEWPAWAAIAGKYGCPLFATEMGANASDFRTSTYNSPLQTLRLARRYVEQLRDARTQATFEWEWTGDYPMTTRRADGTLVLSPRGAMLKQFIAHTATFGTVVETASDDPAVEAATIVGEGDAIAVHLVNRDAERTVRIAGLPAAATRMTLSIVDPRVGALAEQTIGVVDGACTVIVPAGGIATLSNRG